MPTHVPALTRRDAMALSGGALLTSTVAATQIAGAAESAGNLIQRYEAKGTVARLPRISSTVVHGDVVYVSGATANAVQLLLKFRDLSKVDMREQTRSVLANIDERLAEAGTNKSNILVAQVWLKDMKDLAAHNEVWNAWVDPDNLPARICVQSPQLVGPILLVEIKVTAVRIA